MRNIHGFIGAVLVLAFTLPAGAEPGGAPAAKKILAVLDFSNSAELDQFSCNTLADDVREASLVLPRDQYVIQTRESMLTFLDPEGLKKCSEANCEVDAGRRANADLVVSGSIGRFDKDFVATVKLFDTKTAELLGSKSASGATLGVLRENLRNQAQVLFLDAVGQAQGGGAAVVPVPGFAPTSGPVVKKSKVTQVVADLTIVGKPKELVKLEITDPTGKKTTSGSPFKDTRARVGKWKVVASAVGHEDEETTFEVPADEVILQEIEVKPLGSLEVKGTPLGAAVEVTGPGGFKDDSGLPFSVSGLKRGTYRVQVTRETYERYDEMHYVSPGDTTRVNVELKKPSDRPAPAPADRRGRRGSGDAPAATAKKPANYGWDSNNPASLLWSLGIVGINGISGGSDHYSLSIVPSEIGVLLGNRWRIAAAVDLQLVFNSDAPKNTDKDGNKRLLLHAGGVVGMQLFEAGSVGMAVEFGAGFEYNADRCVAWDMSNSEGDRCTSWLELPNGYVVGGKLRIGLLKRWMNVVLRVDYSNVNGVLGGAFFAIGG